MEIKNRYILLAIGITIGIVITVFAYQIIDKDSNKNTPEKIHTEEPNNKKIIQLTDAEINELGIQLAKVGQKKLQMHTDLTGEIVPDPGKLAHIVPRFAGVVKTVYKDIGDKVKKDEVIAVIESNENLVSYKVKSSIEGVVLDLHMTPGELIGDDKHIVTVADLSSVWAELNVYQKDLNEIKLGQDAQIYFNDIENAVSGRIFYLSPTVDEHTRTATARVRLNNSSGYWKPGMFITGKVLTDYVEVNQAVTLNAIQNYEGEKVVFVKDGEGFRPQPVTIGKTNTNYAEVLTGLNSGQTYIAEGAFVIKSELLKESFGGDDDH